MITQVKMSTTLPTGSNTTTLIDTFVALKGTVLAAADIKRIIFGVKNSHAFTLKVYESDDGTTYRQIFGDIAVVAAAATDLSGPYDWLVEPYKYVKVDAVNGGTNQTSWEPYMQFDSDRTAAT